MPTMDRLRARVYALLRWSERFTRTDMVYLTKGFGALASAQAISALVSFILAVLFAHFATQNDYGTYKYFIATASIIGVFTLSGIPGALTRAAALGYNETLPHATKLARRWGVLPAAISLVGSSYYFWNGNEILGYGFLIILVATLYGNSSTLWNAFLEGKREYKLKSLLAVSRNVVSGLLLAAVIYIYPHPLALALTYFGSHLAINLGITLWTQRHLPQGKGVHNGFLRLAKHFTLQNAIKVTATQLDKVLIFQSLGNGPLAVYAFATIVPQQIRDLFQHVATLAYPKFATNTDLPSLRASMFYKTAILLAVMLGVALLYILFAPTLFRVFFPTYADSIWLSQVSALGIAASAAMIPAQVLRARAHVRELYIESYGNSILEIALVCFAAYLGGLVAYVVAVTVSRYTKLLVTLFLASRSLRNEASS